MRRHPPGGEGRPRTTVVGGVCLPSDLRLDKNDYLSILRVPLGASLSDDRTAPCTPCRQPAFQKNIYIALAFLVCLEVRCPHICSETSSSPTSRIGPLRLASYAPPLKEKSRSYHGIAYLVGSSTVALGVPGYSPWITGVSEPETNVYVVSRFG